MSATFLPSASNRSRLCWLHRQTTTLKSLYREKSTYANCKLELEWWPLKEGGAVIIAARRQPVWPALLDVHAVDDFVVSRDRSIRVQRRTGCWGLQSWAEQDFEKLGWVSPERDPKTRARRKQLIQGMTPEIPGRRAGT